eukprot:13755986-Alexandrium_andersonii.AAC.1
MVGAAEPTLITKEPRPKHPWISDATMGKIRERSEAARLGDYSRAAEIDKTIKKAAKEDRRKWFSEKMTGSVWDPVRMLGRDWPTKVVRLRSKTLGKKPAEVYADYLSGDHWSHSRLPAEDPRAASINAITADAAG